MMGIRENIATDEGRALGSRLARFCDLEATKQGKDGRCATCAFRAGDHLANGSAETLMTALKCAMEREPFWCHEAVVPCAGWLLMRSSPESTIAMPWPAIAGFDDPPAPPAPPAHPPADDTGAAVIGQGTQI